MEHLDLSQRVGEGLGDLERPVGARVVGDGYLNWKVKACGEMLVQTMDAVGEDALLVVDGDHDF